MITKHEDPKIQRLYDKWMRLAARPTASKQAIMRAMNEFAMAVAARAAAAVVATMITMLIAGVMGVAANCQQPEGFVVTHNPVADVKLEVHKKKPAIVATSDQSVTVHFSECRENEKQHVSCKMEDGEGNEHWVYIPGLQLKQAAK